MTILSPYILAPLHNPSDQQIANELRRRRALEPVELPKYSPGDIVKLKPGKLSDVLSNIAIILSYEEDHEYQIGYFCITPLHSGEMYYDSTTIYEDYISVTISHI